MDNHLEHRDEGSLAVALVNSRFAAVSAQMAENGRKIETLRADLRDATLRANKIRAAVDARTKQR